MRTFGRPSAPTVASDMAVGSRGSLRLASSNQAANSRSGSSASVKSPLVNQPGCSIGADSDIARSAQVAASGPSAQSRHLVYRGMLFRRHAAAGRLAAVAFSLGLALAGSGCSSSYQLDSLFAKRDGENQSAPRRLARPKSATDALAQAD